jgi:crotonobetainyl-CoA:carnitine CoA-transferase CaiB-like acyl-CoA transferase
VRSLSEFLKQEQYLNHLQNEPLIKIEKIGESEPIAFTSTPSQPLSGIKALGLAHIIAGAGIGRTLSYHGAEALNIWRPSEFEQDFIHATAGVGVRHAVLDLNKEMDKFVSLAKEADVFYANRRPGYLEKHNLSADDLHKIKPGIIHVSVSLFGEEGPLSEAVGYDQNAGAATGIMAIEGTLDNPSLPVVPVVNDWLVPMFATTGIIAALKRRAIEGGSYKVHISLAQVALWILSLGVFDKKYAESKAGSSELHKYIDPETFEADTLLGKYQGITDQVIFSKTPGEFSGSILEPRGYSLPAWKE